MTFVMINQLLNHLIRIKLLLILIALNEVMDFSQYLSFKLIQLQFTKKIPPQKI